LGLPGNAYLNNAHAKPEGTSQRRGLHNVIPAKAGIQEGRPGVAKQFFVYIMASRRNGTLYIGVTSNPVQRVWHHKQDVVEGFTRKYGVKMLVHFEPHETAESAITREKQIKKWERAWKIRLIEQSNPEWRDLYGTICIQTGFPPPRE
jgi:putative endonuclease